MLEDELVDQLKRWGMAKNARHAARSDGPSLGDNLLARQRDLALRHQRKREPEHEICGRSGVERRRFMAAKMTADRNTLSRSSIRMAILPEWAVDPVRARDDGDRPHDRPPLLVDLVPDELHWIDRALARLSRDYPMRAVVVREEYCGTGSQQVKAERVGHDYQGHFSVWMYRRELQRAHDWLRAMAP